MKKYSIPRIDGGVMLMTVADDDADPVAEIAKWAPEMQALVNVAGIKPVANAPKDRVRKQPF